MPPCQRASKGARQSPNTIVNHVFPSIKAAPWQSLPSRQEQATLHVSADLSQCQVTRDCDSRGHMHIRAARAALGPPWLSLGSGSCLDTAPQLYRPQPGPQVSPRSLVPQARPPSSNAGEHKLSFKCSYSSRTKGAPRAIAKNVRGSRLLVFILGVKG